MHLSVIYNTAQHYREAIFLLIEKEFDVQWHFGTMKGTGIKEMDIDNLKRAKRHRTFRLGPLYWQCGMLGCLAKNRPQTILTIGETKSLSLWVMLILRRLFFRNKKILVWTHGYYGKEGFIANKAKKALFGMADFLLPYGERAASMMRKAGLKSDKTLAMHNSLDHKQMLEIRKELHPSAIHSAYFCNKAPVLIFIGRLTPVKRIDLLLEAMSILKNRGMFCNLVLIGDGPERVSLEREAKDAGLSSNVRFFGACYDEKIIAELIFNADVCISPGNIGLTAIHSLTYGCPAATHNDFSHQMPEFEVIKEGETGFFFEYGNALSIANGTEKWLNERKKDRNYVREKCYKLIDTEWNPDYQLRILKKAIYG